MKQERKDSLFLSCWEVKKKNDWRDECSAIIHSINVGDQYTYFPKYSSGYPTAFKDGFHKQLYHKNQAEIILNTDAMLDLLRCLMFHFTVSSPMSKVECFKATVFNIFYLPMPVACYKVRDKCRRREIKFP